MKTYALTMSAECEAESREDAVHQFDSALEEGALKYEVEEATRGASVSDKTKVDTRELLLLHRVADASAECVRMADARDEPPQEEVTEAFVRLRESIIAHDLHRAALLAFAKKDAEENTNKMRQSRMKD